MTKDEMISFLESCARYFETRDTKGEDLAHWANVYNAENCRKIIEYIKEMDLIFPRWRIGIKDHDRR